MRVIAGSAKGRRLTAPPGERTRPTADRVKEALFSSLQAALPGAAVLDLYAGSGALGIEALSRGAATATFVERHARAIASLRQNLEVTGLVTRAAVVERDVLTALRGPLADEPFDLAFLDPPYALDPASLAEVLAALEPHLADGATITVELGVRSAAPRWPPHAEPVRERRYGDTLLHVATVRREGVR